MRDTGLISFVTISPSNFFNQRLACSSACSVRVMKKNEERKVVVEALSASIFVTLFFHRNGCKKHIMHPALLNYQAEQFLLPKAIIQIKCP